MLEQVYTMMRFDPLVPMSVDEIRDRMKKSSQYCINEAKTLPNRSAFLRTAHLHLEISLRASKIVQELVLRGALKVFHEQ